MYKQLSIFDTPIESTDNHYLHIEGDIPTDLPDGAFISLARKTPPKIYSLGFRKNMLLYPSIY